MRKVVAIVLITLVQIINCFENWKKFSEPNWEFYRNEGLQKIKCKDPEGCEGSSSYPEEFFKHAMKKNQFQSFPPSALANMQLTERNRAGIIPYYRPVKVGACSCNMEYQLEDLGPRFFPRFIRTGICNKESCGPQRYCTEKLYKMRVLKERDMAIQEDNEDEIIMPESLKESWTSIPIDVVVACECAPYMQSLYS